MIREIVKPEGNTYVLNLPNEMVGKTLEVTVSEVKEMKSQASVKKSIEQLNKELEGLTVNLEGFKFDRDEANDYD